MSNEEEAFPAVNFSIASSLTNVRLMEVSDEVLQLITASKGQSAQSARLHFKSAPPSTSDTSVVARHSLASKAKDSVLHLCSKDKSWAIKQVSTSNSVYLIQPSKTLPDETGGSAEITEPGEDISKTARRSVIAVSQVRNFLELHAVKIEDFDIKRTILDLVPLYDDSEENGESLHQVRQNKKPALSFDSLSENIAAPDSIIQKVCMQLCVFNSTNVRRAGSEVTRNHSQQCYLPSPSTLLNTWSRISEACAIELIRLDHALNDQRIIETLQDLTTDKDVARVMLRPGGMLDELELTQTTSSHDNFTSTDHNNGENGNNDDKTTNISHNGTGLRYLKPQATTLFIASLILRAEIYRHICRDDGKEIEYLSFTLNAFLQRWTDLVPSSFAKYCTLDHLRSQSWVVIHTVAAAATSSSPAITGREQEYIRWKNDDLEGVVLEGYFGDVDGAAASSGMHLLSSSSGVGNAASTTAKSSATTRAGATAAAAAAAAVGKRKWHEKFGAQRSAKK